MGNIEVLFILPVVSLAVLGFILVRIMQDRRGKSASERELEREVVQFNSGAQLDKVLSPDTPEKRMNELERRIAVISRSLAVKERLAAKYQRENAAYRDEVARLKKSLRELQREYDILLSETYTLRAKVKKLMQDGPGDVVGDFHIREADPGPISQTFNPSTEQVGLETLEMQRAALSKLEETTRIDLDDLGR